MKELSPVILRTIIILALVAIVDQFATDCYLAAFPAIARKFNVTNSSVQLSLTLFFIGVALAQFFYGVLSDLYGRKPMLMIGTAVFIVGSLICVVATNIDMFLMGRFIQGFGMGSGAVIARAMARDLFSGVKFSQMVSALSGLIILIMLISPIEGGYIQHYLGWRYIFILLAILASVLFFSILFWLHETHTADKRIDKKITNILQSYLILLQDRFFMINILCACIPTLVIVIYITITPFLYQHVFKVSPVMFGWMTAAVGFGGAVGNLINSKIVTKFGMDTIIKYSVVSMLLAVLVMLTIALFGISNLAVVAIPMFIAAMTVGPISANACAKALNPFPDKAGAAAALYGGIQIFLSAIFTALAALVHTKNQIPLALLLLIPPSALVALLFLEGRRSIIQVLA